VAPVGSIWVPCESNKQRRSALSPSNSFAWSIMIRWLTSLPLPQQYLMQRSLALLLDRLRVLSSRIGHSQPPRSWQPEAATRQYVGDTWTFSSSGIS